MDVVNFLRNLLKRLCLAISEKQVKMPHVLQPVRMLIVDFDKDKFIFE